MLEIQNLKEVYGNETKYKTLEGTNLTVQDGEFIDIMGSSRGGESTLLNLLTTINSPTDGEILLSGENPSNLNQEQVAKSRRTKLGFAFQDFNPMPTLIVEENIILPLTPSGEKVSIMKQRSVGLGERLGINHLSKERITEISDGQAQQIAIVRAMVHHSQLSLADRPIGDLDMKSFKDVMSLSQRLSEEETAIILMVTHDPPTANYCKCIIFIKDGELIDEIVQSGNQKEFYDLITVELAEVEGVDNKF